MNENHEICSAYERGQLQATLWDARKLTQQILTEITYLEYMLPHQDPTVAINSILKTQQILLELKELMPIMLRTHRDLWEALHPPPATKP